MARKSKKDKRLRSVRGMRAAAQGRPLTLESLECRRLLTTSISEILEYQNVAAPPQGSSTYQFGSMGLIRDATVMVYSGAEPPLGVAAPTGSLLGTFYTDDTGAFDATVNVPATTSGLFIQVNALSPATDPTTRAPIPYGGVNVRPETQPGARPSSPYSFYAQIVAPNNQPVPSGQLPAGTVELTASNAAAQQGVITAPDWNDPNASWVVDGAFAVYDSILLGAQFGATLYGAASSPLANVTAIAEFPVTQQQGLLAGAWFDPTTSIISLTGGSAFDMDTVLHEFGHYFAMRSGIFVYDAGGDHAFENQRVAAPTVGNPPPTKDSGIPLAMNEGYATYYAVEAGLWGATQFPSSIGIIVGAGNDSYNSTITTPPPPTQTTLPVVAADWNVSLVTDPTTQTGGTADVLSTGEDNEITNARILYALDNGYTAPGVSIPAMGSQWVLNVMKQPDPLTGVGFVNSTQALWNVLATAMMRGLPNAQASLLGMQYGALFAASGVGAQPVALSSSVTYTASMAAPPTFTWRIPVAYKLVSAADAPATLASGNLLPLFDDFTLGFFDSVGNEINVNGLGMGHGLGFAGSNTNKDPQGYDNTFTAFDATWALDPTKKFYIGSWTPTSQQWAQIAWSARAVNWVVVSRDDWSMLPPAMQSSVTIYEMTGNYWGGASSFTVTTGVQLPVQQQNIPAGAGTSLEIDLNSPAGPGGVTVQYAIAGAPSTWTFTNNSPPPGGMNPGDEGEDDGSGDGGDEQEDDDSGTTGTVYFPPGATSEIVSAAPGPGEEDSSFSFTFTISNPTNATLGDDTVETVNVEGDDGGGGGGGPGDPPGGPGDPTPQQPKLVAVSVMAMPTADLTVMLDDPDNVLDGAAVDVSYTTSDGYSGDAMFTAGQTLSAGTFDSNSYIVDPPPGYELVPYVVATATFTAPGMSSATGEVWGIEAIQVTQGQQPSPPPAPSPAPNPPQTTYSVTASSGVLDKKTEDTGTFTFTRSGDLSQATVGYYTLGGTAELGTDYDLVDGKGNLLAGGTVVFLAGESQETVDIKALDNPSDDGDGAGDPPQLTVTAHVDNFDGDGTQTESDATLNIQDIVKPQVSIAAMNDAISEAFDSTAFVLTRTGDLSQSLAVTYGEFGDEIDGQDYYHLFRGSRPERAGSGTQALTVRSSGRDECIRTMSGMRALRRDEVRPMLFCEKFL